MLSLRWLEPSCQSCGAYREGTGLPSAASEAQLPQEHLAAPATLCRCCSTGSDSLPLQTVRATWL